jgi:phospholipase C
VRESVMDGQLSVISNIVVLMLENRSFEELDPR